MFTPDPIEREVPPDDSSLNRCAKVHSGAHSATKGRVHSRHEGAHAGFAYLSRWVHEKCTLWTEPKFASSRRVCENVVPAKWVCEKTCLTTVRACLAMLLARADIPAQNRVLSMKIGAKLKHTQCFSHVAKVHYRERVANTQKGCDLTPCAKMRMLQKCDSVEQRSTRKDSVSQLCTICSVKTREDRLNEQRRMHMLHTRGVATQGVCVQKCVLHPGIACASGARLHEHVLPLAFTSEIGNSKGMSPEPMYESV